jgi:hypothetical protein
VSATAIRTVLLRNGLRPAPRRAPASWRAFLRAQASAIVAVDFFTVETVRLKTLSVLFLIELQTRRVRLVGVTNHPTGPWVVQRARELSMSREEDRVAGPSAPRFLIRDRDSKFTRAFDDVFAADGILIIMTPTQAPNANAVAERWVRTVRQGCLDWMLIWGRRHRPTRPCRSSSGCCATPRFQVHLTPTYSSWLNLVERWFAELTNRKLRRSAHRSVAELEADLAAWIQAWNEDPKPFVWTKTADEILANLTRYLQRINNSGH